MSNVKLILGIVLFITLGWFMMEYAIDYNELKDIDKCKRQLVADFKPGFGYEVNKWNEQVLDNHDRCIER